MKVTRAETEDELARCLHIRRVVFIEEQAVPEAEEVDGRDADCLHYLLYDDTGTAIATARVLPKGDAAKIQRVAVLKEARTGGVGSMLMRAMLEDLHQQGSYERAILGSQTHAIGFYEKLGFAVFGPEYDDAGIPHRDMEIML